MIIIECPICGLKGSPQHICKHFVKVHTNDYIVVKEYIMKYNQGWICKICGKDFLFITSAYEHVVKEHFGNGDTIKYLDRQFNRQMEVIERW